MALAKMTWDELNQLVGYKVSEPYDEYFDPMQISQAQKKKRIEMAERLEEVFLALLAECFYAEQYNTALSSDIYTRTRDAYMDAIESAVVPDDYLFEHCMVLITGAVEVLYKNRDNPYYYSHDRAKAIAENEANSVFNHTEYEDAVKSKKYKTWHTIMDGRERDSHAEINGARIPIEDTFVLRGGECYYPRDDSLGMSDEEICGCRCSLSFS